MSDLIKKLQAITDESDECYTTDLCHEAADALEAMEKRVAELEAVRDAAKGLANGEDWNNGTHAKIYRPKLIAALKGAG